MDKIISEEPILADSGFYWRVREGVKVLASRMLDDAGFENGFSTRLGGVSSMTAEPLESTIGGNRSEELISRRAEPLSHGTKTGPDLNLAGFDEDRAENIYENRRRFINVFGGRYKLASVWQVHGDGIKSVRTAADADSNEDKFDAIISDMSGLLIGVKTADCVPVLIGDPITRSFAAIHAGWRGTSQLIVRKAVEKMAKEFGSSPKDLLCAIGPAALCGNYEIGQEVIDTISKAFSSPERYFKPTRDGHALVDLHLANEDLLIDSGVRPESIHKAPFCTMGRTDLFFSYRVEKPRYGKTGRLMSVIGLASDKFTELSRS